MPAANYPMPRRGAALGGVAGVCTGCGGACAGWWRRRMIREFKQQQQQQQQRARRPRGRPPPEQARAQGGRGCCNATTPMEQRARAMRGTARRALRTAALARSRTTPAWTACRAISSTPLSLRKSAQPPGAGDLDQPVTNRVFQAEMLANRGSLDRINKTLETSISINATVVEWEQYSTLAAHLRNSNYLVSYSATSLEIPRVKGGTPLVEFDALFVVVNPATNRKELVVLATKTGVKAQHLYQLINRASNFANFVEYVRRLQEPDYPPHLATEELTCLYEALVGVDVWHPRLFIGWKRKPDGTVPQLAGDLGIGQVFFSGMRYAVNDTGRAVVLARKASSPG